MTVYFLRRCLWYHCCCFCLYTFLQNDLYDGRINVKHFYKNIENVSVLWIHRQAGGNDCLDCYCFNNLLVHLRDELTASTGWDTISCASLSATCKPWVVAIAFSSIKSFSSVKSFSVRSLQEMFSSRSPKTKAVISTSRRYSCRNWEVDTNFQISCNVIGQGLWCTLFVLPEPILLSNLEFKIGCEFLKQISNVWVHWLAGKYKTFQNLVCFCSHEGNIHKVFLSFSLMLLTFRKCSNWVW